MLPWSTLYKDENGYVWDAAINMIIGMGYGSDEYTDEYGNVWSMSTGRMIQSASQTVSSAPPYSRSVLYPIETQKDEKLPYGYYQPYTNTNAELREQRKAEGRCQQCGELLRMDWQGLQPCLVCEPEPIADWGKERKKRK